MPLTAQDYVARFRVREKNVSPETALSYLNEADVLIQRVLRTRKKTVNLAIVAGTRQISLDESYVWVPRATWLTSPGDAEGPATGTELVEVTTDTKDIWSPGWQQRNYGDPSQFMQSHDATGGVLEFDVAPDESTLTVTDASNATPIVITTQTHGLSDGDRVELRDVGGNTAANTWGYAKRTGYSTTTFALYSDEDLTTPVAGSGAFTSGGLILCAGSPLLELLVVFHDPLSFKDPMPATPFLTRLYLNGMSFIHAQDRRSRDPKALASAQATFEDALNEQDLITNKRAGRVNKQIRTIVQRAVDHLTPSNRSW